MINKLNELIKTLISFLNPKKIEKKSSISGGVDHSLKKYTETYKLLEKYDKSVAKDPESMADPGRLRTYIQGLQG